MSRKEQGIDYDKIVDQRDAKNLAELMEWYKDACSRAENCKCPQCKKEARKVSDLGHEYVETATKAPLVDHEELIVASTAFRNLLK